MVKFLLIIIGIPLFILVISIGSISLIIRHILHNIPNYSFINRLLNFKRFSFLENFIKHPSSIDSLHSGHSNQTEYENIKPLKPCPKCGIYMNPVDLNTHKSSNCL